MNSKNVINTTNTPTKNDNIEVLKIDETAYAGLTVSELTTDASNEAVTETILIAEWVRPDWSERPLLKCDYPQMGYVVYSDGPSP